MTVFQRQKKPTTHEARMRLFIESVYQTLRRYQDGGFSARSAGVAAGQLDIPLTSVLDAIKQAADQHFSHRFSGPKRNAAK